MMENFIERLKSDKQFRETIVDSLCNGIKESSQFRDTIYYVIDNRLEQIQNQTDELYEDEDDIILLILPSIRRAWAKIYIETPRIFEMPKIVTETKGYKPDKRLELFQLYFDIDDFVDYLIEMFNKTKNLLNDFEFLDKTQETLTLIVDNYIASLIQKVINCDDMEKEMRHLKIKKVI